MQRVVSIVLALSLCLTLTAGAVQVGTQADSKFSPAVTAQEWEVLALSNVERLKEGRLPLSTFDSLHQAARIRANELTQHYRSDHSRPDGSSCFTVLEDVNLHDWGGLGENIAKGQRTPAVVVAAWMDSPGHRGNILKEAYTHMGVGNDGSNSWEQFFLGTCTLTPQSVLPERETFLTGTSIDDMGALLVLSCSHGESYLPITKEMCTGYDPLSKGSQTIKVAYGSQTLSWEVTVEGAGEYPYTAAQAAGELNRLGLLQGVGTLADGSPDFALDKDCTRQEAVILLLRLLGRESAVTPADGNRNPFTDVANWAAPYLGYAYTNGIARGVSATTFQGEKAVSAAQGVTFVLRALGYESGLDFPWNGPWTLSNQLGLTLGQYPGEGDDAISRGEMVLLCRAALDCRLSQSDATLRQDLSQRGVIAS